MGYDIIMCMVQYDSSPQQDGVPPNQQLQTLTPEMRKEVEQIVKKKVGFWIMMNRLGLVYNLIVILVISGALGYFVVKILPVVQQMRQTQQRVEKVMDDVKGAVPFFPGFDEDGTADDQPTMFDPENPEMDINMVLDNLFQDITGDNSDVTPTDSP